MEYRFKRDLKNSFMIIDSGFKNMGYEQDVLKNNDINVLVPFHTLDVNNVTQVWYDITGLVSLQDYLMQQGITVDLIRKVLVYLKIAIDEVERYLIDINHLLFDADTIYVVKNNNDWKLMFIYYPDDDSTVDLGSIMEFIMSNSSKELMDLCIKLYDSALDGTNIDGLIKLIDDEKLYDEVGEPSSDKLYEESESEENTNDIFPDNDDFWDEERSFNEMLEHGGRGRPSLMEKIKKFFVDYFSKKRDVLGDKVKGFVPELSHEDFVVEPDMQIYEPTVLLKPNEECSKMASHELHYMGNNHNDNIRINKDEILLGSSKEGNDSVIDSPVISRFHAKIVRKGQEIYVEDLNSTNGTSVNGKLLGYKDRIHLRPNDEVMFANERYRVV